MCICLYICMDYEIKIGSSRRRNYRRNVQVYSKDLENFFIGYVANVEPTRLHWSGRDLAISTRPLPTRQCDTTAVHHARTFARDIVNNARVPRRVIIHDSRVPRDATLIVVMYRVYPPGGGRDRPLPYHE